MLYQITMERLNGSEHTDVKDNWLKLFVNKGYFALTLNAASLLVLQSAGLLGYSDTFVRQRVEMVNVRQFTFNTIKS